MRHWYKVKERTSSNSFKEVYLLNKMMSEADISSDQNEAYTNNYYDGWIRVKNHGLY